MPLPAVTRPDPPPINGPRINGVYIALVSAVAALGGFLFGLDICLMSGAILFLKKEFALNASQEGFAMTSAMPACLVAPLIGGWLSDRLGRRKTLVIAGFLFAASALGTAAAGSMLDFNLYRLIGGFGVGIACVISPMYIAEVAPARIRGRLVTLNQLAIVIGAVASIVVAYAFSFSGNWRAMFASQLVPVGLFMIGLLAVPESPRWLVQRGRNDEAAALLARIGGTSDPHGEIDSISASLSQESGKLGELFAPGIRVALFIAVALAVFQQFTGVSIVQAYAPTIFKQAGYSDDTQAIGIYVLLRCWDFVCTVAALWLVDRVGRRPLLLAGTCGMALGLALLGGCFHFHVTGPAVPLTMMLATTAYLMSLAPLAWLIMAEIFPNRIRGKAMGIASVALWGSSYAGVWGFPVLTRAFEERFGSPAAVFWLFAAVCLLAFVFCWKMIPETKGRSLEEIAQSWTAM